MKTQPQVSLREVTADTVRTICALKVADNQTHFVAPNAYSIAEAYFEPNAWFRAIYAGETAVGFLMTAEVPEQSLYYLWRFMIAENQQGKGYGRAALEQLIERIKTEPNAQILKLSVVPGEGSAITFYQKLGFVPTGEIDHDELVHELPLWPSSPPKTGDQEMTSDSEKLMSDEEQAICHQISAQGEAPHNQRATALWQLNQGDSHEDAAAKSGLTVNQVKHWRGRFRTQRLAIFPEALTVLPAIAETEEVIAETEETQPQEVSESTKKEGKKKKKDKKGKDKKGKKKKKDKKDKKDKKIRRIRKRKKGKRTKRARRKTNRKKQAKNSD